MGNVDRLRFADDIKDFVPRVPQIISDLGWGGLGVMFGLTRAHGELYLIPPQSQHHLNISHEPFEAMSRAAEHLLYHPEEATSRLLRKELLSPGELIAVGVWFMSLTKDGMSHEEMLDEMVDAVQEGHLATCVPGVKPTQTLLVVDMQAVTYMFVQKPGEDGMSCVRDFTHLDYVASNTPLLDGLVAVAGAMAHQLPPGQSYREGFLTSAKADTRDAYQRLGQSATF